MILKVFGNRPLWQGQQRPAPPLAHDKLSYLRLSAIFLEITVEDFFVVQVFSSHFPDQFHRIIIEFNMMTLFLGGIILEIFASPLENSHASPVQEPLDSIKH